MKGKRLRSSAIDKHQPRCQHLTSSTISTLLRRSSEKLRKSAISAKADIATVISNQVAARHAFYLASLHRCAVISTAKLTAVRISAWRRFRSTPLLFASADLVEKPPITPSRRGACSFTAQWGTLLIRDGARC